MTAQDDYSFLKGVLFGGIVGAVTALLFAPKSGKELRAELTDKGAETLDEAKRAYTETWGKAKAIMDDALQRAEELKKEAQRQLSEARQKAKEILKEAEGKKSQETGQTE